MTRVQMRFELAQPLDEPLLARIADAHAVYGILRIVPARKRPRITVRRQQ